MSLKVMRDFSEIIDYNNPRIPIYARDGRLSLFVNMTAMCHWHEDIEFLIPVKGHLSYHVNGQIFQLQEGDGILVNSRQMHYGFSADGSDCEYICVVFKPQLLCSNYLIQEQLILPIINDDLFTEVCLKRANPLHAKLLNLVTSIYQTYTQKNKDSAVLSTMSLLYETWSVLYEIIIPLADMDVKKDNEELQLQKKMLHYIYNHYSEKITLAAIAQAGGVCRSRCCQIFKKYLNHSPNEYLNSYRLEKSMELLKSTDLSITEIAFQCGFRTSSYFSETFMAYKGCSPSAYRGGQGDGSGVSI